MWPVCSWKINSMSYFQLSQEKHLLYFKSNVFGFSWARCKTGHSQKAHAENSPRAQWNHCTGSTLSNCHTSCGRMWTGPEGPQGFSRWQVFSLHGRYVWRCRKALYSWSSSTKACLSAEKWGPRYYGLLSYFYIHLFLQWQLKAVARSTNCKTGKPNLDHFSGRVICCNVHAGGSEESCSPS